MRKVVGIDRKIKRAWVDSILDRLTHTTDEAELRKFLDKQLKDELPGKESRQKAVGIVLRIWSGIPPERIALRDRAVAMLPRITGQERIWLHWGMTALAYPFFRDTAEVVGRLLALQDDFTTAQVQGRMLTTWGDRVTTKLAARYLLNTLVDWEVLRSTKSKGHFLLTRKTPASTPDLPLWLLEALLAASEADEIEAQQLLRLPEAFPFALTVGIADLRRHQSFNIHRQGLDMDMVALRKVKLEPPPKLSKKPSKKKRPTKSAGPTLFDMQGDTHVSSNGPTVKPAATTSSAAERETPCGVIQRQQMLVPDGPFAAPSTECAELFQHGYHLGCIVLTQAVIEAVIRHVWQVKFKKKPNQEGSFDKNLEALHKRKFISDELTTKLHQMWADRHSFHHLRPSVECDPQKLEALARDTLNLLNDLEHVFFAFDVNEGIVVPEHPEFWRIRNGESVVFVRSVEHAPS